MEWEEWEEWDFKRMAAILLKNETTIQFCASSLPRHIYQQCCLLRSCVTFEFEICMLYCFGVILTRNRYL